MGQSSTKTYVKESIQIYKNIKINEIDQSSAKEKVKLTITFYNVQDFNQKWGISFYKNKQRRDYKIGGQTMLKIKYHLLNFL